MSELDKPKYWPWQFYLIVACVAAVAFCIPLPWWSHLIGGMISTWYGVSAGIQRERTRAK